MKKNSIKYVIDISLFITICAISTIGVLLALVIPGGKAVWASKYFFGLHRHDLRYIHFYLSVTFLILLSFHLWFNRAWIIQSTKQVFGNGWKCALWCLSIVWTWVFVTAWVIALR